MQNLIQNCYYHRVEILTQNWYDAIIGCKINSELLQEITEFYWNPRGWWGAKFNSKLNIMRQNYYKTDKTGIQNLFQSTHVDVQIYVKSWYDNYVQNLIHNIEAGFSILWIFMWLSLE